MSDLPNIEGSVFSVPLGSDRYLRPLTLRREVKLGREWWVIEAAPTNQRDEYQRIAVSAATIRAIAEIVK